MEKARPHLAALSKVAMMDHAAISPGMDPDGQAAEDLRGAPRSTLLIRTAKLVSPQGEFVCVIRDVSSSGTSVRLFHALPPSERFALELQNGETYEIERKWARGKEAGFCFSGEVVVDRLIEEASKFPRRGLRLAVQFPIEIGTLDVRERGLVENLSLQGARLNCKGLFAIDQSVWLKGEGMGEVRAKVRWRRSETYGVVFDDTFSLGDFARLSASLQCPALLND